MPILQKSFFYTFKLKPGGMLILCMYIYIYTSIYIYTYVYIYIYIQPKEIACAAKNMGLYMKSMKSNKKKDQKKIQKHQTIVYLVKKVKLTKKNNIWIGIGIDQSICHTIFWGYYMNIQLLNMDWYYPCCMIMWKKTNAIFTYHDWGWFIFLAPINMVMTWRWFMKLVSPQLVVLYASHCPKTWP